ncbi:MAG: SulP family inorganic anion transporter [Rickettsiaceae bacterium]|nr:SulP family inorganic anion transporter [Rickettsiaceae bacterium]
MKYLRLLFTSSYKTEILSGLTVALALVPEAVAFAFVAGVHPLIGLYSAFIICLICSMLGGRPGMISGATGALAVVAVNLVSQHGLEYLFAAVVLMGIIQIIAGILKLGKFIKIVPYPVMLGFVNGLAIVIGLAQLQHFKSREIDNSLHWLSGDKLWIMLGLVSITMLITKYLPKITRIIPSPLAAIITTTLIVLGFKIDTSLVRDLANIAGGLPQFHIPRVPLNMDTLYIIFPYSIILAAIGLIESLLTLTLIDDITDTRGKNSKECIAQGIANTVTGFFSGMGGCAMIGQSMINIKSGARKYLSGIAAASFLLFFIMYTSSLIEMVPIAALVGVMFMVVIDTFEWVSLRILHRIPKSDAFIIVVVTTVTVYTDLAIAVIVGIIVAAIVFSWESAKHITTDNKIDPNGTKVYKLYGPLFFASASRFRELFDLENDPDDVVIDFEHSRVWDHSGLEAIDALTERYFKANKKLSLKHLSSDCHSLLKNASNAIELNLSEDPHYMVAVDKE